MPKRVLMKGNLFPYRDIGALNQDNGSTTRALCSSYTSFDDRAGVIQRKTPGRKF
jgi:hypothetical protein